MLIFNSLRFAHHLKTTNPCKNTGVRQQSVVGNIPTIFLKNLTKSLQIQLR